MKFLLWLLLVSNLALGADADRAILNEAAGGDIAVIVKNSLGTKVEVSRFSPPLGDISRSVGTVGSVANSQGALASTDFTTAASSHWYNLAGDSNDSTTGSALNLTQNGTPLFITQGFFGRENTVKFLGAQSLSSASATFSTGNSTISLGGWFYVDAASSNNNASLISNANFGSNQGWSLRYTTTGIVWVVNAATTITGPVISTNTWYHFAVTYNTSGTLHTLYVNGQKYGTGTANPVAPGANFRVGAEGPTAGAFLTGSAQDVFWTTDLLTDSQVNAMYSHRYTNTQQVAAGHVLAASSFPVTTLTSKVAFYNLTDLTDGSGNAKTLLNANTAQACTTGGSAAFTALGITGATDALTLNGSSFNLCSADSFFNPGNGHSVAFGGWFASYGWVGPEQALISIYQSNADRGMTLKITSNGGITYSITNTAGSDDVNINISGAVASFVNGSWHHFLVYFDYPGQVIRLYIDGALFNSSPATNLRSLITPAFKIGAYNSPTTPASFFNGRADEVFFIKDVQLTDADIRKFYSAKLTHSKNISAANQTWFSSWLREDSKMALPLENGWMLDMNANALFVDFSDLNPGDYVTIKAK